MCPYSPWMEAAVDLFSETKSRSLVTEEDSTVCSLSSASPRKLASQP